jgi:hypothetical protein
VHDPHYLPTDAEATQTKNNFLNTVAENKVSLTTLFDLILKAKGNQFPRDVAIAVRSLDDFFIRTYAPPDTPGAFNRDSDGWPSTRKRTRRCISASPKARSCGKRR